MMEPRQSRAARALLDWSRQDLADRAKLSLSAVTTFENETRQPETSTLNAIRAIFDTAGIEFLPGGGVRPKQEEMEVLTGHAGLCRFLDDVYAHLSSQGGRVLVTGVEEDQWTQNLADYSPFHIARMTKLFAERDDIEVLSLLQDGDSNFKSSGYCQYRWQPRDVFDKVPFYVYGDNLGIILFDATPQLKIFLIRSATVAAAYRNQFDTMWQAAKPPPEYRESKEK
jgi:transcriptional regulator with XRE-family HTH domain